MSGYKNQGIGGPRMYCPTPAPASERDSLYREWVKVDSAIDDANKGLWKATDKEMRDMKAKRAKLDGLLNPA
jgi:hypothetical protein